MDWDDLRIYLQLVRSRHMNGAAKILGVDDSTVARRIARLEKELGVALIERAGRRTVVTEKGKQLAEAAEELESLVLRKIVGISESETSISGRVRVGAPEGIGVGYLSKCLAVLAAQNECLETELVSLPRTYSLAAREVDIAISLDRPIAGQLTVQKLTDYTLDLYGTDAYVETHGRPLIVPDLTRHTFAGYIPELLFTKQLNFMNLKDNVEVAPRARTTSVVGQLEAIDSGAAIGVLPTFLARNRSSLRLLLAEDFQIVRTYWISVHEDLRSSPRVQFVLKAIAAAVKRDRGIFLRRQDCKPTS